MRFSKILNAKDYEIFSSSFPRSNVSSEEFSIRLGEYDITKESKSRKDFEIETIYMHEDYNRMTFKNDVALIKLKSKVTFDANISPICLPPSNIDVEGKNAWIAGRKFICHFSNHICYTENTILGWGRLAYQDKTSNVMLDVMLPIWKLPECRAAYDRTISDNELCAGFKEGGNSACRVIFKPFSFKLISLNMKLLCTNFNIFRVILEVRLCIKRIPIVTL